MLARYILIVVAALLPLTAISAQEKSEDVIRVDTSLVNIPVIVSDRDNRYIPGLARSNFKVFQDGTEQKIEVFSNENAPMNIVLALDTSRSTTGVLGKIKKAAKEFIKNLDADDRCMIVTFDSDVLVLSDLTSDKRALEKAVNHAKIGEQFGTVLQDAVYTSINSKLRSIKGRKAIILLTDGKDFGSLTSKNKLFDSVSESDTVIYPVFYVTGGMRQMAPQFPRFPDGGMRRFPGGLGRFPGGGNRRNPFPDNRFPRNPGNFPGGRARQAQEAQDALDVAFLERLAELTGGHFFKEQKADLKDVFRQITDEMKRQYLLGFYPAEESPAGTVHKIKVKVDQPGAVVRSKGAYRTQSR